MTARHRDLDNLAHRLDRAANIVPDVLDHLDEQRAYAPVLAAHDYSNPIGTGGISDPTLRTVGQLDEATLRARRIKDWIAQIALDVKWLEQDCRSALGWRMGQRPTDNLDHLEGTPRCIGAGNGITTHCEQIPVPRPDGQGSRIDDGRCLDCGRRYDADETERRRQAADNRRTRRYGRV